MHASHATIVDGTPPRTLSRARAVLVLLLACAAGSVDAVGYFSFHHIFTANMTGNTVNLGVAIGLGNWITMVRAASAVVGFAGGTAIGALMVERDTSAAPWPPSVTRALAIEWLVLLAVGVTWVAVGQRIPALRPELVLLVLLAVGMGIQSAAARRLRISGIVTTYITGTLTSLVAGVVRRAMGREESAPEAPTHGSLLLLLVWITYLGSAIVTTVAANGGGPRSMVLPLCVLGAAVIGAHRLILRERVR